MKVQNLLHADGEGRGSVPTSVRRLVMIGAAAALLGGCATAKVGGVATEGEPGQRPAEILVDVHPAADVDAPHLAAASQASDQLEQALIQNLEKSGITAEAYNGAAGKGAALLHVSITDADPGNAVERFVIGLGAGKAKLQVNAELQLGKEATTKFATSSDSGHKLGLIVPGGVAAATGQAIHLAIGGGIDVATSVHGGMERPLHATSTAIVQQIHKCYEQAGWYWPRA